MLRIAETTSSRFSRTAKQVEKLLATNPELKCSCRRVLVVGRHTSDEFDYGGLRGYLESVYVAIAEQEAKEQRDAEEKAWRGDPGSKKGW